MREEFGTHGCESGNHGIKVSLGDVVLEPVGLGCGYGSAESGNLRFVVNLPDCGAHGHVVSQTLTLGNECAKYRGVGIESPDGPDGGTHGGDIVGRCGIGLYHGAHGVYVFKQRVGCGLHALCRVVLRCRLVDGTRIDLELGHGEHVAARLVGLHVVAQEFVFRPEVYRDHDRLRQIAHADFLDKRPVTAVGSVVGRIDIDTVRTFRFAPLGGFGILH